jgi:hypothetical protein
MPKRKKNNPMKRQNAIAKSLIGGRYVIFVGGGKCQIADPRLNICYPATQNEIAAFAEHRHKWTILVAALGVDNNNRRYIKSHEIQCTEYYFQSEIADLCADVHRALLDEFNGNHFINVGWLASATPIEFDEKKALTLFEKAGGFSVCN